MQISWYRYLYIAYRFRPCGRACTWRWRHWGRGSSLWWRGPSTATSSPEHGVAWENKSSERRRTRAIVAIQDLGMTTLCALCAPCRDTRGPGPPRDHCAGNPSPCRCRSLAISRWSMIIITCCWNGFDNIYQQPSCRVGPRRRSCGALRSCQAARRRCGCCRSPSRPRCWWWSCNPLTPSWHHSIVNTFKLLGAVMLY